MYKRKKYLVKRGLQFRYIGAILLTVFFIAVVCAFTTYYNLLIILGEKLANVYPQGRLMVTLRSTSLVILFRVILLIPFVALIGLLLSHTIAGPIFRMEKVLKEVGEGKLDVDIKLRKRDELKDFAEVINEMTDNLKKQKLSRKKTIEEVKELIKKEPANKEAITSRLNSIL